MEGGAPRRRRPDAVTSSDRRGAGRCVHEVRTSRGVSLRHELFQTEEETVQPMRQFATRQALAFSGKLGID
jgi:hypothetical protein